MSCDLPRLAVLLGYNNRAIPPENNMGTTGGGQTEADGSIFARPWIQLVLGVICMASVANLQYGWTWFVDPINAKYHWGRPDIQWAFTLFVLIETWLVPV